MSSKKQALSERYSADETRENCPHFFLSFKEQKNGQER